MGVKTCIYCKAKSSQNISLIKIPSEKEESWLQLLNVTKKSNQKLAYICNQHFNENDFVDSKKTRLLPSAVPILNTTPSETENVN